MKKKDLRFEISVVGGEVNFKLECVGGELLKEAFYTILSNDLMPDEDRNVLMYAISDALIRVFEEEEDKIESLAVMQQLKNIINPNISLN